MDIHVQHSHSLRGRGKTKKELDASSMKSMKNPKKDKLSSRNATQQPLRDKTWSFEYSEKFWDLQRNTQWNRRSQPTEIFSQACTSRSAEIFTDFPIFPCDWWTGASLFNVEERKKNKILDENTRRVVLKYLESIKFYTALHDAYTLYEREFK